MPLDPAIIIRVLFGSLQKIGNLIAIIAKRIFLAAVLA
jgi:hypothetical protein